MANGRQRVEKMRAGAEAHRQNPAASSPMLLQSATDFAAIVERRFRKNAFIF